MAVTSFSKTQLAWIVSGLCALAALRVFLFAAAFPFFNNVDEQAHTDLVMKYAHCEPPRSIERFSSEAARYFALYRTPEYFITPEEYGGQFPSPNWLLPVDERDKVVTEEITLWESRDNHESGEPPVYYGVAGVWFDLGRAIGLDGLTLLYWLRFLNIPFAIALVWVGYTAARITFPGQLFAPIATATLLAIWPQSSFYSIQGDSLAPVTFGVAFFSMAKLMQSERPKVWLAVLTGLSLAATCLIKTVNLPLSLVVTIALGLNLVRIVRRGRLSTIVVFLLSLGVPICIWFAWNEQHFGDLTATKSKIELLGWTPKAFSDWWSHPIFTPKGFKDFWVELIASFWRGEFIWHGQRMASWWNDAFYWCASAVALAIALVTLIRGRADANTKALWLALVSVASLVGFLMFLSIRFDFGQCPYPSREHPYFTSGRLLNAAAVPFFLLFAYAIDRVAIWTKRDWAKWILLGVIALATISWQLSINAPALESGYNFFHRQTSH